MSILSSEFIDDYKNKSVPWGFGALSYVVYKRTYARELENGITEEWYQTVARCINGAQDIGAQYTKEEAERLYDLIFNLKCSFAGRFLWQLGTDTIKRYGGNSLQNCWFLSIRKPSDFSFVFENLMLGGGVGFSVKKEDVYQLPKVKRALITHEETKDADFIVPDSRQGWVKLLDEVLRAYFVTGKGFTYSTILVRGKGEKIKGFGGTASGPVVLIDGIEKICGILDSRVGKKLRSIDALDICNILGSVVVAGNVRRSAEIALGDADDLLFLRAKDWSTGNIPNHRAFSNNTIYADSYDYLTPEFWNGYNGNGEPYGLMNLPLAKSNGRIGELINDNCAGMNPCGEITLADYECCCLSEIFLNNIENELELWDSIRLLYKAQKASLTLPFIHDETNKIVKQNMRIGVSTTGIFQSLDKVQWLKNAYNRLREFDNEWSKYLGVNRSIKLTTVKPSGTVSLLAGSTPGIHPAYANYYIRRVRMGSNDPLVEYCRNLGYKIEYVKQFDGSLNYDTVVVEFPCYSSGKSAKEVTAIEQLEVLKLMQTTWADNSVSCTVYYRKEELSDIKEWLKENYETHVKSVSFLLHSDHNFDQPPYEEVDQDTYFDLVMKVKPIVALNSTGDLDLEECASGACPVK